MQKCFRSGVFALRGFLSTSMPEILKSKILCNESLNILAETSQTALNLVRQVESSCECKQN